MRDRAILDFIRDRVLAEIRANPSVRPYLGEAEAVSRARRTCDLGHPIAVVGQRRRCRDCRNAWKRRRRMEGVAS